MELDRIPEITKYLSVIFLFVWIGRSTVWSFLPIYFERQVASVFLVGLMTSLPAAIPIVLDIPIGNLVQRAGERSVLFSGLIISMLPPLLYLSAMPALLVLGKVSEGLTIGLVWNAGWSLNMKAAEDEVESESISVFFLGMNLAIIIGPIIGGYLIAARGFRLPMLLWIFTTVLGILIYYVYVGIGSSESFMSSFKDLERRQTYVDDWHHLRDNWTDLRPALGLVFLYSMIFSFYWLAVPLLLERQDATFPEMGLVFGLALVPKLFQFFFGTLADRFGSLRILTVMALPLSVLLLLLSHFTGLLAIAGLFLAARTLSGGMSPPIHAYFDSKVPDELEGELTGFMELFKHTGQAIGPVAAGAISQAYSVQSSFLFASGIAIVIAVTSFSISD
ncbi:MAG: MFS transporter [Candidatus Nanohaloarchaea archaeon]